MFSSMKIGRFYGIDVYIHSTFYLLLAWILFAHLFAGQTLLMAMNGVLFILLLFLCVVLHEYGHALMARSFGIQTKDITLYPIGGVARLEEMPEDPMEELWVALAGPAVNVVIAAGLALYLYATRTFVPLDRLGVAQGSMVERLMIVNLFLVGFNLLPAFPMDGGRVLRAFLARQMDYVQATRIAAQIGKGMALLFGFAGFFLNPFLLFIAFFVWVGADGEASQVQIRRLLKGVPVSDVMVTTFEAVAPADTLDDVRERFRHTSQNSFPVMKEGDVVGLITVHRLMEEIAQRGAETPVQEVMTRDVVTLDPAEMLDEALRKLQEKGQDMAPVVQDGQPVGLVTAEHTQRYLMYRSSLQKSSSSA